MHNPQEIKKRLETAISRIPDEPKANKETILKFVNECYSLGLGDNRILSFVNRLTLISKWLGKDFKEVTKEDLKVLLGKIEKGQTYSRRLKNHVIEQKQYSEWSISTYKKMIKKFWQWLKGYEWHSKDFPEEVKWMRTGARTARLEDPTVLTKDEVRKLFEAAEGIREKALVSFMYESGCRAPDELLTLKISDVEFVESGAKVRLCSGKVGSRTVLLVSCVPYLKQWIENEHPNPKHDSHLWTNRGTRNHGKAMTDITLRVMVRDWAKKAGITKRVTPYTFRRTRYTHLSTKIPTPALYKIMGQVQGSNCIRRYVALNNDDTDDVILNFYGIKQNSSNNHDIKPLFCSICGKQAPPEKQFCPQCNAPLTEKAKLHVEEKKTSDLKELVEAMIKSGMQAELEKMANVIVQKRLEEGAKKPTVS